ncbi:MAG: hypothetical protein BWZ03_00573 [bacterium ADurb.BinA186]|nr:MAG: hypothetical protein BWZ03_00573 [bacterium ADurb.BinA186]
MPTLGSSNNHRDCLIVDIDFLCLGDLLKVFAKIFFADTVKIKALCAGDYCRRHFVSFCCCQNKNCMGRRLFKRFKKGIKGFLGQHMNFIDDVNLELCFGRRELNIFPKLADLVDASIGCGIDLNHIYRFAGKNIAARFTLIAWLRIKFAALLFRIDNHLAIRNLGDQAGSCRLAGTPRAGEKICMSDLAVLNRLKQGIANMILSNKIAEFLWPVFSVQ